MLHVDGIEADDGSVETDVCFCSVVTEVVRRGVGRKVGFSSVESFEEGGYGFVVGFLGASDAVSGGD